MLARKRFPADLPLLYRLAVKVFDGHHGGMLPLRRGVWRNNRVTRRLEVLLDKALQPNKRCSQGADVLALSADRASAITPCSLHLLSLSLSLGVDVDARRRDVGVTQHACNNIKRDILRHRVCCHGVSQPVG